MMSDYCLSSEPILVDTGRSTCGWSFWGSAFSCEQLWYRLNVEQRKLIPAAALTQGSMGHVALAHHYARHGATQEGGFNYEGVQATDPDMFLDPDEAIKEWCRRAMAADGTDGWPYVANTMELLSRYAQRGPIHDRVVGVEMPIAMVIGHKEGEWGLWLEDDTVEPTLLDAPGLEEPHPNVPALQHGKPIRITKRFDLAVTSHQDNRTYIWDHKVTGGGVGGKRAEQYAMDGQFAVNRIAGRQLWGKQFGGVLLNLCQRRSPWTVSRQVVPETPFRDEAFPTQLWRRAHRIADLLAAGAPIRQWEMTQSELACYHRYGKCGAFDLCRFG